MKRLSDNYSGIILAVFCAVTIVALLYAGATTAAPFGAYNPSWDGGAGLRSTADSVGAETAIIQNTSRVADYSANDSITIVIAPETRYSEKSVRRLSNYVEAGGTLLVADDVPGPTNDLLEKLGARARLDGRHIRDERSHYRSPALPVATNVSNHSLTTGVSSLTLNYGTPVRPNGATTLVSTSEYAYLDENRNGELDETESLDSHPVTTVEELGSGRVIVVGDPSVFINAMLEQQGNQQFATNVFGRAEYFILDYSRAGQIPPVVGALIAVRSSTLIQIVIGGVGLSLIALWSARPTRISRIRRYMPGIWNRINTEEDQFDIEAIIKQTHPDWEDERIQRVTQGVKPQHEKGGPNDRTR